MIAYENGGVPLIALPLIVHEPYPREVHVAVVEIELVNNGDVSQLIVYAVTPSAVPAGGEKNTSICVPDKLYATTPEGGPGISRGMAGVDVELPLPLPFVGLIITVYRFPAVNPSR